MKNLIQQICRIQYEEANALIHKISGIVNYFSSEEEKSLFTASYDDEMSSVCEERVAYGDWQTPSLLADKVCEAHRLKFGAPDVMIEPTCGLGSFVMSALRIFPELSEIHALEINRQYVEDLKFNILTYALCNKSRRWPDIYIYQGDFFKFDFSTIIEKAKKGDQNLGIIGNPPWVTNSKQGLIDSENVPKKSNRYNLSGIEAITGKSNFDISEYITLNLLGLSQFNKGGMSFLLKNSVIRNVVLKQKEDRFRIGCVEQCLIDAQTEFNVSVDASCFSARFNAEPAMFCKIKDFYSGRSVRDYGWVDESFVADMEEYCKMSRFDNRSSYIWRSGVKHDCASILELTFEDGALKNGLGEIVKIEDDLIFPLLKSSDVVKLKNQQFRKYIIIPQKKVGEDTSLLEHTHPRAYAYLKKHENVFVNRKSSIYKGKGQFSIFGIGDYSFKPYKILVSSLYKEIKFVLVNEIDGRPIMVDDTCYQLDFDDLNEAQSVYAALQSEEIRSLLESLVFTDAKRVVTKGILMRLDLQRWCREKGCLVRERDEKGSESRQLSLFE